MAFPADLTADFRFECRELDTSRYVYHYTTRDTALQHILSGRKIRLGPLAKTNDPRETKSWRFGISGELGFSEDKRERTEEIKKLNEIFEMTKIIRGNCKVLCTSMDDPAYNPGDFHEFKRGFGHSRMWAQYGEAYTGVCLIFDRVVLDEAIRRELNGRCTIYDAVVEYSDSATGRQILAEALDADEIARHGLESAIKRHRQRNYRIFFFRKSNDWSQEFECRWIAIGENEEPEFVPIDNAIAGIVVGVDFPKIYLPTVIPLCSELKIPGVRIGWENGIPSIRERFV